MYKLVSNYYLFLLLIACLSILSCSDKPDFTDAPTIEFRSISKNQLQQSSTNATDTLEVIIYFEDGDGDIGHDRTDGNFAPFDVIYIDNRTGDVGQMFNLPYVPEQGSGNGITGTARMTLLSTCCVFNDGTPPCESPIDKPTNDLIYEVYILDRAGNQSNTITLPAITLLCN